MARTTSADLTFKTTLLMTPTVVKGRLLKSPPQPSSKQKQKQNMRKPVEWKKPCVISFQGKYLVMIISHSSRYLYTDVLTRHSLTAKVARGVFTPASARGAADRPLPPLIYGPRFPERPITHPQRVRRHIVTATERVDTQQSRVPSMRPRSGEQRNNGKPGGDEGGGRVLTKRSEPRHRPSR